MSKKASPSGSAESVVYLENDRRVVDFEASRCQKAINAFMVEYRPTAQGFASMLGSDLFTLAELKQHAAVDLQDSLYAVYDLLEQKNSETRPLEVSWIPFAVFAEETRILALHATCSVKDGVRPCTLSWTKGEQTESIVCHNFAVASRLMREFLRNHIKPTVYR